MKSWVLLALVPVLLSGCAGTNPLQRTFTPYGPQCVPPPPTGTIGYGQGYYVPSNRTASVPISGQNTRTGQLQPVPTLGSQPASPAQPRTSAAPTNDDWESTKSATLPPVDFGASRAPVQPSRAMPRGVQQDNRLAWIPPFGHGANNGVVQASATSPYSTSPYGTSQNIAYEQPQPSYRTPPTYVAPIAATVPDYNPIRPSIVRQATFSSPAASLPADDCNCDVSNAPPGVPIAQPATYANDPYASGPYAGSDAIYTAVENSNWQQRR